MTKSMPVLAIAATVVALAGCASTPPQKPVASSTPAPATAAASTAAPAAAPAQQPELTGPIDGQKLVALEHAGYTLVTRNGETLYCEINAKTGTRIARDPVCLTEAQLRQLRERTQQNMDNIARQVAPRQGK